MEEVWESVLRVEESEVKRGVGTCVGAWESVLGCGEGKGRGVGGVGKCDRVWGCREVCWSVGGGVGEVLEEM